MTMIRKTHAALLAALLAAAAGAAMAQAGGVSVDQPWVRATVAPQTATGAFARITSAAGGRLVGVSSPLGQAELHEMAVDANNVMRMRAVPAIELPAGKAVELRPGGHHVMITGLKQAVKVGDSVPLTLVVEGRDGKRENVVLQAAVRPLNSGSSAGHGHGHGAGGADHKH